MNLRLYSISTKRTIIIVLNSSLNMKLKLLYVELLPEEVVLGSYKREG